MKIYVAAVLLRGKHMDTIKSGKKNIIRVGTSEDLAHAALSSFCGRARVAIVEKGRFNVAISGGHTPERFFELLGCTDEGRSVEWDKVQVFWVDERCVSPEADASNYGLAAHTFLDKVAIPPENVHRMSGEVSDYDTVVKEYEQTIRNVFNLSPGQLPCFDLIILGMGDDGHIGSLFPNSAALFDTQDLVSAVYFMDGNYNRITLTHPVICAAKHLVILIGGSEKADILKEVLCGEPDEVKYPVHTLWPILDKVTWLIDEEAAKHI